MVTHKQKAEHQVTGPDVKNRPETVERPAVGPRPERLHQEFETLGLGPAEARAVVALLRLGSAGSTELAKEAAIPRTGIYQCLKSLQDKHLVLRLEGGGPARWTTEGRDKVLDRLQTAKVAAQQEEIEQHKLRTTLLREMLADAVPEPGLPNLPYVHIITCPAQLRDENLRLLKQATEEVLVFNRPPYATAAAETHNATMQAVERGVTIRILTQSAQADDPETPGFRDAAQAYMAAGIEARIADELPIKLLVVDRRVAILSLDNPVFLDSGFPVTQLLEHPGLAGLLAEVFDNRWAASRAFAPTPKRRPRR